MSDNIQNEGRAALEEKAGGSLWEFPQPTTLMDVLERALSRDDQRGALMSCVPS